MRQRSFADRASPTHGLVVFDHDGCGRESTPREVLEAELEGRFAGVGWGGRAAAVIISPEVESWIWSESPAVDAELGWTGRSPGLCAWLAARGWLRGVKPHHPKEAYRAALLAVNRKPSPERLSRLAAQVSFQRCVDPAFLKLKTALQSWFPATTKVLEEADRQRRVVLSLSPGTSGRTSTRKPGPR